MMRIINSILAVSICVLAHSQSMLPLVQDTNINDCNHEISLSGVVDFQATSIGKDITKSFIYGGFIDDAMK